MTTQTETARSTMSRTLTRTIADLRDRFMPYARTWDALLDRRRDLARPFMAGFALWHKETGRSFVAFVQQIDPTVPADKAGYVAHRSYQACLYLRRLVDAPATATPRGRTSKTPFDMLAAVMKTLIPAARPYEDLLWASFARASHWRDRDLDRLRAAVKRAAPLPLRPDAPRLVTGKRSTSRLSASGAEARTH